MTGRHVTTGLTLLVLICLLGVGAVYGFKAATAPLPGSSAPSPTCTGVEKNVKTVLRRSEVQVSVFNGSGRSGLAASTLDAVESAGFIAGNAGNTPKGAKVVTAVVWTTKPDDPAARLVAKAFGNKTKIVVTDVDLGPGIDVLLGKKFSGLNPKAPRKIKLPAPVESCIAIK
ncbi:MAG: LytR C-terminal domain-containing protein [Marmoricola sp.]